MNTVSPNGSNKRFWIFDLTQRERSTFVATFSGWALDGMDAMIYSFVIPPLMTEWQMNQGEAGILVSVPLVVSAIGGWVAGVLADRLGRARMLQVTVIWFAVFTFLSGFTTSFWQLLTTRSLQGLGFGGEWAVGSVLIGEVIRAQYRGKAVGTVQSGWAVGWGITAIANALLFHWLPAELAWRAMFWIGILPSFLIFYIQRYVPEPDIFQRSRPRGAKSVEQTNFLQIFNSTWLRITLLASLLAAGAQGGYYAITTWLPTYLTISQGLSIITTSGYLIIIIAGSFVGYLVSAWLSDSIGRKKTLFLFAVCSLIAVLAYTHFKIANGVMLVLGFPLGFFASGSFSPMGAFFTELFPTHLRGSGQGFSYNVGRGIGAFFPTLIGYLSTRIGLGSAIATFAVFAYFVMAAGALMLPETRGRELMGQH